MFSNNVDTVFLKISPEIKKFIINDKIKKCELRLGSVGLRDLKHFE